MASSTHPRHHARHQQPDRAQGVDDRAADHERVPRRGRDSAARTATTSTTSSWRCRGRSRPPPPPRGRRAGAGEWRGRQAAQPPRPGSCWSGSSREEGVEAIAVCLIHSYANPDHERAIGELMARRASRALGLALAPRPADHPRVRADQHDRAQRLCPGPVLPRPARRRLRTLGFGGQLFVMLSMGGIGTIETATRFPIRSLCPAAAERCNSLLRPDDRRGLQLDVVRHGRDPDGQAVRGREGPAADRQQQRN